MFASLSPTFANVQRPRCASLIGQLFPVEVWNRLLTYWDNSWLESSKVGRREWEFDNSKHSLVIARCFCTHCFSAIVDTARSHSSCWWRCWPWDILIERCSSLTLWPSSSSRHFLAKRRPCHPIRAYRHDTAPTSSTRAVLGDSPSLTTILADHNASLSNPTQSPM